jgi:peptide-methionine (S)-S-oxide reductase
MPIPAKTLCILKKCWLSQRSAVSGRWSVVSGYRSAVSGWRLAVVRLSAHAEVSAQFLVHCWITAPNQMRNICPLGFLASLDFPDSLFPIASLNPMSLEPVALEIATFAAGCFWQVEAAFQAIPGVCATSVGYMGGHFANPSYLDVLSRITGHAEVCQAEYDPSLVSYSELLDIFWRIHDPTSLNRQGADRGEQYRSAIFYHTPEQARIAHQAVRQLDASGRYERAIVTQIQPASDYWLATDDHQKYLAKKKQPQIPKTNT